MDHGTEGSVDVDELLSLAISAAHVPRRGGASPRGWTQRACVSPRDGRDEVVGDGPRHGGRPRKSEQLIVDLLLSSRPHDGIVGEEGGERQGTSGIEWVIDPIDGTTNFFYGIPGFSISVAASDADGAVVGVVHDPMRAETFSAVRGKGAWLNEEPLGAPSAVPPITEALVATGFSYSAELRRRQAQLLPDVLATVRDIRRSGSVALDLCYVAAGRLDAFYEALPKRWASKRVRS